MQMLYCLWQIRLTSAAEYPVKSIHLLNAVSDAESWATSEMMAFLPVENMTCAWTTDAEMQNTLPIRDLVTSRFQGYTLTPSHPTCPYVADFTMDVEKMTLGLLYFVALLNSRMH